MTSQRRKKTMAITLTLILFVGVSVIVLRILASSWIAEKIKTEADRRALQISYSTLSFSLSEISIEGLKIQPRSNQHWGLQSKTACIQLRWFQPELISINNVDLSIHGGIDEVLDAFEEIRKANANVPSKESIAIQINSGKLHWNELIGPQTQLVFNQVSLQQDPHKKTLNGSFKNGVFETGLYTLKPLSMLLEAASTDALRIDVAINSNNYGELDLHYEQNTRHELIQVNLSKFALQVLNPPKSIEASNTTLSGSIDYKRTTKGETSSNADLNVKSLTLNSLSLGPISVSPTVTANIHWKAQPNDKEAGAMHVTSTSQVLVGKSTYTLRATGDMYTGAKSRGPYRMQLNWSIDPIACSDLAQKLSGGLIHNAIQGSVSGSGQIMLNGINFWNAHMTRTFVIGCELSVGGLLKDIPL